MRHFTICLPPACLLEVLSASDYVTEEHYIIYVFVLILMQIYWIFYSL